MKRDWPPPPETLEFAADEVHVWAVPLECDPPANALQAILSAEEKQRAKQFRFDAPRRRFVVARTALRTILGRYLSLAPEAVPLEYGSNGKPQLGEPAAATSLEFNLAHSGELALMAVTSGCSVGIDVELLRQVSHSDYIARRYFSTTEAAAIAAADDNSTADCFLHCWSRKEAVLKMLGSGIGGPLNEFEVPTAAVASDRIALPPRNDAAASSCWLQDIDVGSDYVAALASRDQRRLTCYAYV